VFPSHEKLFAAIREIVTATSKRPCRACLATGRRDTLGWNTIYYLKGRQNTKHLFKTDEENRWL
jgi:hypothetical protein